MHLSLLIFWLITLSCAIAIPVPTTEESLHPTISSHVVKEGLETRQAADIQVHNAFTTPLNHSSIAQSETHTHGEESSISTKAMDPVESVSLTPPQTEIESSAPHPDDEIPELERRGFGSFLSGAMHLASHIPGPIGMVAKAGTAIQHGVQALRGH
ncbi:hypothetical protein FRC15_003598 [Serendipita sp. 397]|nr:hypothetical protein FRC15_003598 [Serendipita sp. 397]KAG8779608.1 hypothetical protein FRC16_003376 [Serendipita sp. 398]